MIRQLIQSTFSARWIARLRLHSVGQLWGAGVVAVVIMTGAVSIEATEFDEPDLSYELKMHDIFLNHHTQPISSRVWSDLLGDRRTEMYRVQRGDTLWGISKIFFGDGGYWPKIWAINSRIGNPHRIEIGQKIFFLPGTRGQAPTIGVTPSKNNDPANNLSSNESGYGDADEEDSSGQAVISVEKPSGEVISAYLDQDKGVRIPPPLVGTRAPLKRLPPSLGTWGHSANVQKHFFQGSGRVNAKHSPPALWLSNAIFSRRPSYVGKVKGTQSMLGREMALQGELVYLQFNSKTSVNVGQTYTVVRPDPGLERGDNVPRGSLGYPISLIGEVSVIEDVSGGSSRKVYLARVNRHVLPVQSRDRLITMAQPKVSFTTEGVRRKVDAQFIGTPASYKLALGSRLTFAYINKGTTSGVNTGDILSICQNTQNLKVYKSDKPVADVGKLIGWARVAQADTAHSTVAIVRAWDAVQVGAFAGHSKCNIHNSWSKSGQALSGKALSLDTDPPTTDDDSSDDLDEIDLSDEL